MTYYNIQKRLEKETGGKPRQCGDEFVDIVSETEVIEIHEWEKYTKALGNILFYKDEFPDKTPRVHLFGKKPEPNKVNFILNLFETYDITVTEE